MVFLAFVLVAATVVAAWLPLTSIAAWAGLSGFGHLAARESFHVAAHFLIFMVVAALASKGLERPIHALAVLVLVMGGGLLVEWVQLAGERPTRAMLYPIGFDLAVNCAGAFCGVCLARILRSFPVRSRG